MIRNPGAVRPWQHALEPLSGYLCLAEALLLEGPEYAQAWNFGPWDADARPVRWIVERLCALSEGGPGYRVEVDPAQPHEAHHLKLDISKARGRLGWQPRWSLAECLARVVEWHRAYRREDDMRAVTLRQIAAFEADPAPQMEGAHFGQA